MLNLPSYTRNGMLHPCFPGFHSLCYFQLCALSSSLSFIYLLFHLQIWVFLVFKYLGWRYWSNDRLDHLRQNFRTTQAIKFVLVGFIMWMMKKKSIWLCLQFKDDTDNLCANSSCGKVFLRASKGHNSHTKPTIIKLVLYISQI